MMLSNLMSSRMPSSMNVIAATRSSRMLQHTHPLAIDDSSLAFDADHELGIDVDRTEVVHQHRDPQAVVVGQDAVQQRRLAGAKKAGQDGQRNGGCAGLIGRGHRDALSASPGTP